MKIFLKSKAIFYLLSIFLLLATSYTSGSQDALPKAYAELSDKSKKRIEEFLKNEKKQTGIPNLVRLISLICSNSFPFPDWKKLEQKIFTPKYFYEKIYKLIKKKDQEHKRISGYM